MSADPVPPASIATRLHSSIAALRAAMPQSGSQVCELLGADPRNDRERNRVGIEFLEMITRIRCAIDALPPRKKREPLVRHLPAFEKFFFGVFFGDEPSTYPSLPDGSAMYGLEMCAEALDEYEISEPTLSSQEATDLIQLVHDLVAAIKSDGDLTAEAKTYLIDRLLEVERAILHIEVVGMDRLQATVDRLVGSSIAFPEAHKPRVIEWMAKLWRAAHGLAIGTKAIADAGTSVVSLTEALSNRGT